MSDSLLGLEGTAALVTGAGQGGGRGIALMLARAGANVAVVDMDRVLAEKTAADARALGVRALPLVADATDEDSVTRMVTETVREFGGLDIGVNNVGNFGSFPPTPVVEQTLDFWDKCVDQNLRSTFLCSKTFAATMIAAKTEGSIINIASLSGLRGSVNLAPYGAVKAGVMHFTQTLALELAPHRIRVNCVAPTAIDAPSLHGSLEPRFIAEMAHAIPLGRLCGLEELGGAVLLLASKLASFVTGQTLMCDGGASVTTMRPSIPVRPE
jgi:NAD(P)-dependent dehydrogenase (short-subunit alcohol dehydrogenase family)